jgi:putative mRNA 3-end processing factor
MKPQDLQPAEPGAAPLEVERTAFGLRLRGSQLVLDPRGRAPLGFVANARAVRSSMPERTIATTGTIELLAASLERRGEATSTLPVPYRQTFGLGPLTLSLHPAGCARGSAWLRCELGDKTIAWAPDLGGSGGRALACAEPRVQPECDVLVLRATFGHPRCVFPPRAPLYGRLLEFVRATLDEKRTPVVLAAPLGGAQEAALFLSREGHRLLLHPALHRLGLACARLGAPKSEHAPFDRAPRAGEVVIAPYGARIGRRGPLGPHRTVLLSGAALEPGAAARAGADLALPISDHAGFDELVAVALGSGASRVIVVEGYAAELSAELCRQGLEAVAIGAERQLELF